MRAMRRAPVPAALLSVLSLLVAGCADAEGAPGAQPLVDDSEFDGLDATATTGVIRGVVVDEAIRPIAGATVVLALGSTTRTETTSDAGAFGFSQLEPGTYFLTVSKAGFSPVQQGVEVQAGVSEPPIAKVLLVADPEQRPYYEILQWEGFIQCSARFFINALAACSAAPGSQDNFSYRINPTVVPHFAQSEMVWDSTQAAGDGLKIQYTDDSDGLDNYAIAVGGSPLVINANQTLMASKNVGNETGLYIRVFSGSVEGTQMPVCLPTGLCEGASVVVNQSFTVYTVLFYNMLPPDGWQFGRDGAPPTPPA